MIHLVPHSECAIHMRIAGKPIVAFRFQFNNQFLAEVWVKDQDPYQARCGIRRSYIRSVAL